MKIQMIIILFVTLTLLLVGHSKIRAQESTSTRHPIHEKLANVARHFLRLPYRWGGMSEQRGMDCSGLVKTIFSKVNIPLPRTSREQFSTGTDVSVENLQTGDLLFFSTDGMTPSHVGIYIGRNLFVHAEKKAGYVIVTDLNQPWYDRHFLGARRVVGL